MGDGNFTVLGAETDVSFKLPSDNTFGIDKLVNYYAVKRKYSFVFEVQGIDPWVLVDVSRPQLYVDESGSICYEPITVKLHDTVEPSTSKCVMEWVDAATKRSGRLRLMNEKGDVIENWNFQNLFPARVDFGSMSYAAEGTCCIEMRLSYDSVTLE